MKYSVGAIVLYKELDLKFEIMEVTNIAYKCQFIPNDPIKKKPIPELYPHHFIEGEEFELSLKSVLKQL